MILIYTGPGKGKTSACLGQVMRALGHGLRVGFVQFMKRDGEAGEQIFLHTLLGDKFLAGGAGFFTRESQRPTHRAAAEKALAWAREAMPDLDLLVLDEALYALGNALLTLEEVKTLMEQSRTAGCHLVLSGRGFPAELEALADTITEMREVRHPWQNGHSAVKGIDY